MKPTPEQCNKWYIESCKRVNASKTTELLHVNAVMHIVCELAAAWGAEQSLDGKRWIAIRDAGSELTLRLHNSRPDQREAVVDNAMKGE